jgi:hypothetical protein
MLDKRYAVIGCGVAQSTMLNLGPPEPNSIEGMLAATQGPARFVPTHLGRSLPAVAIDQLTARLNADPRYFAFEPTAIREMDGLIVVDTCTSARDGS